MVFVASHWYACVIALQASLHADPHLTWLGPELYSFCEGSFPNSSSIGVSDIEGDNSLALAGCHGLGVGTWYLASFSWSIMVITGTGGTDFFPSNKSDAETIVVTVLVLIGALLWTTVIAKFCDVATNSNPGIVHFRQQLDGLNQYVATNHLPEEMAKRMREYLHQQKGVQLREHAAMSLPRLSMPLQIEAVLHINGQWLSAVWFFKHVEEICLVRFAMAMHLRVLAPGEVAPLRHLYVVQRGVVLWGGRVLSQGMVWGDDILLQNKELFLPFPAKAMSYTDVTSLSREALLRTIESFPLSATQIRWAAIRLALKRRLLQMLREERTRNSRAKQNYEQGPSKFLEQVQYDVAAAEQQQGQARSINMAAELVLEEGEGLGDAQSPARALSRASRASTESAKLVQGFEGNLRRLQEEHSTFAGATANKMTNLQEDMAEMRKDMQQVLTYLRASPSHLSSKLNWPVQTASTSSPSHD